MCFYFLLLAYFRALHKVQLTNSLLGFGVCFLSADSLCKSFQLR